VSNETDARKRIQKVAILDIDYHAGNGTASIFYEDPTVLTVSIHRHPDHDYPFTVALPIRLVPVRA
jgi:acetoin utilization deacetylase AcuC-like enzyme